MREVYAPVEKRTIVEVGRPCVPLVPCTADVVYLPVDAAEVGV